MTQGICFYVDYLKYSILCSVAIHSLCKHYDGAIHVIHGEHCPKAFLWGLKRQKRVTYAPANQEVRKAARGIPLGRLRECWYRKPYLHLESPFDVTLMYDSDHVFVSEFDMNAFELIEQFNLASFHTRPMSAKSYRTKARRVRYVLRDRKYLFHYPANGGCVGSVKGSGVVEIWCRNMEKILSHESRVANTLSRVADEYSLAYTLQKFGGMGDAKWSCGADRADAVTIGIHYVRKGYLGDALFQTALKQAVDEEFLGLHKLRPSAMEQYASWVRAKHEKRHKQLRQHYRKRK
jgi:hypothetical protein